MWNVSFWYSEPSIESTSEGSIDKGIEWPVAEVENESRSISEAVELHLGWQHKVNRGIKEWE